MKNSHFGNNRKINNRNHFHDNDWEVAEEISPDPFSEELHTHIHARRFSKDQKSKSIKNQENINNQENS